MSAAGCFRKWMFARGNVQRLEQEMKEIEKKMEACAFNGGLWNKVKFDFLLVDREVARDRVEKAKKKENYWKEQFEKENKV